MNDTIRLSNNENQPAYPRQASCAPLGSTSEKGLTLEALSREVLAANANKWKSLGEKLRKSHNNAVVIDRELMPFPYWPGWCWKTDFKVLSPSGSQEDKLGRPSKSSIKQQQYMESRGHYRYLVNRHIKACAVPLGDGAGSEAIVMVPPQRLKLEDFVRSVRFETLQQWCLALEAAKLCRIVMPHELALSDGESTIVLGSAGLEPATEKTGTSLPFLEVVATRPFLLVKQSQDGRIALLAAVFPKATN